VLNPWDIGANYGPQNFDYKFIFNLSMYYQPPVFKGQHGVLGHVLGGWTVSPLFTAISGAPTGVGYTEDSCTACQAFGEVTTPGTSAVSSTSENAVGLSPYTGNMKLNYNVYPTGVNANSLVEGAQSVGTKTTSYFGENAFANPAQVYDEFRPCVLGYDSSCGGYYNLRGLPTWNLDTNFVKDIGVYKERVGVQFFISITNILNHFQASNPGINLNSPTSFGQITSQANTPRNMEFGVRVHW
jgi:hypothetical protein